MQIHQKKFVASALLRKKVDINDKNFLISQFIISVNFWMYLLAKHLLQLNWEVMITEIDFSLFNSEKILVVGILLELVFVFPFTNWKYYMYSELEKILLEKVLLFMALLFFKVAVKLPLFYVIKVQVALLSKNLLLYVFFYDLAQFKKLLLCLRD